MSSLKDVERMMAFTENTHMCDIDYIDNDSIHLESWDEDVPISDFKEIAALIHRDGYDIAEFELLEIPHPQVFCFGNLENNQYFDVVKFFDNKWQFAYSKNCSSVVASSIADAISNYEIYITYTCCRCGTEENILRKYSKNINKIIESAENKLDYVCQKCRKRNKRRRNSSHDIKIYSKADFVKKVIPKYKKCTLVISITDPWNPPVDYTVNPNICGLSLQFEDSETFAGVSREDAQKIAQFINKHKDSCKNIAVHCEAGQSRSAGVAAAIGEYLNGSSDFVFKSSKYHPSMRCYEYVLAALNEYGTSEDAWNIEIYSQQDFIDKIVHGIKCPVLAISITGPRDEPVNWQENPYIKGLSIAFRDTENDTGISCEDAEEIAQFILKNKNEYKHIVVHCSAGISRSSGVAAAISKYLNSTDEDIFDSPKYVPNMRCYRYVLNAFERINK